MSTTYSAGGSAGQPLEIPAMKDIAIANESLDKDTAHEGETVVYTTVIRDEAMVALPVGFVVDLELDMTKLITGQALDSSVYDPATCILTLPFVVPAMPGSHTVKLAWAEQTI